MSFAHEFLEGYVLRNEPDPWRAPEPRFWSYRIPVPQPRPVIKHRACPHCGAVDSFYLFLIGNDYRLQCAVCRGTPAG